MSCGAVKGSGCFQIEHKVSSKNMGSDVPIVPQARHHLSSIFASARNDGSLSVGTGL